MSAFSFQKQWKLFGKDKKKKTLHYTEAYILKQDSPLTTVLVTEGLCPGKSFKRWKQRQNPFRCLANELWLAELWRTTRVNGQIVLQEVTGPFGISFFFFTITFSWGTKDFCPEIQSPKLINSVIKSQIRFVHSWGHNNVELCLLPNALK